MTIETLYDRANVIKKIKTKIDRMNLGCECDFDTVSASEVKIVLKFKQPPAERPPIGFHG